MINIDSLGKFPIFNGIDESCLEEILPHFSFHNLRAGQVLFRRGDDGDAMYMIARGRIEVVIELDNARQTVATLGEGSFFGEMALMTDEKRTATVKAVIATSLIALDRTGFKQMMAAGHLGASDIAYNIATILAQRLQAADSVIMDILGRREGKSEIREYRKRLLEEWEF